MRKKKTQALTLDYKKNRQNKKSSFRRNKT